MTGPSLPMAYGTTFGKAVPHWAMRTVTWSQFCTLLKQPAPSKTSALSYLLGTLQPGPGVKCKCDEFLHRTKANLVSRAAITLDADYCGNAGSGLVAAIKRLRVLAAAHTTWSSTEDDERYRIIVPLSRPITPNEYGPIARLLMKSLCESFFDSTCDQASRLMYLPASPDNGDRYWWGEFRGDLLDADVWLDLAGGPDVRESNTYEVPTGEGVPVMPLSDPRHKALRGLCEKLANCQEGNRDSLLLWSLKASQDNFIHPDIAGPLLVAAGVHAGLDEDVCWEKVKRILG